MDLKRSSMSMFRIKQQMDEQVTNLDKSIKEDEEGKIKEAIEKGLKSKVAGEVGNVIKQQAEAGASKVKMMSDMHRKHFKGLTTFINAYHQKLTHSTSNSSHAQLQAAIGQSMRQADHEV